MRLKFLLILIALSTFEALLSLAFYYGLTRAHPGANDFYVPWRATQAALLERRDPYSAEVTRDIQRVLFGQPRAAHEHQFSFAYPLTVSWLLAPLVWLPYDIASAIWLAFLLSLLLAAGLLMLRALDLTLKPLPLVALTLWLMGLYPAVRALFLGQLAIVVFACVVGVWWCLHTRRDSLAGALLSITAIKPQMMLLLLPFILWWAWRAQRHRVWQGFVVALGAQCLFAFALQPTWLFGFIQATIAYSGYYDSRSPLQIVLGNNLLALSVSVLLVGLWCSAVWRNARANAAWPQHVRLALWSIIITQLIAVHTATPNQLMLTLPIFMELPSHRQTRRSQWLITAWLALLLIVPWWIFFVTLIGDTEHEVVLLPLSLGVFGWWGLLAMQRRAKRLT
jgi:hypothetical protein